MARSKPAKAPPVRRKAVRKEAQVLVRMTEDQKVLLADAAEANGLGLSTWLLSLGLREAKKTKTA